MSSIRFFSWPWATDLQLHANHAFCRFFDCILALGYDVIRWYWIFQTEAFTERIGITININLKLSCSWILLFTFELNCFSCRKFLTCVDHHCQNLGRVLNIANQRFSKRFFFFKISIWLCLMLVFFFSKKWTFYNFSVWVYQHDTWDIMIFERVCCTCMRMFNIIKRSLKT